MPDNSSSPALYNAERHFVALWSMIIVWLKNITTYYEHIPAWLINASSLGKRLQVDKCGEMLSVFAGLVCGPLGYLC